MDIMQGATRRPRTGLKAGQMEAVLWVDHKEEVKILQEGQKSVIILQIQSRN